jgi:hypothetical protein
MADHVGVYTQGDRWVSVAETGRDDMDRGAASSKVVAWTWRRSCRRACGRASSGCASLCALISLVMSDDTVSGWTGSPKAVQTRDHRGVTRAGAGILREPGGTGGHRADSGAGSMPRPDGREPSGRGAATRSARPHPQAGSFPQQRTHNDRDREN